MNEAIKELKKNKSYYKDDDSFAFGVGDDMPSIRDAKKSAEAKAKEICKGKGKGRPEYLGYEYGEATVNRYPVYQCVVLAKCGPGAD